MKRNWRFAFRCEKSFERSGKHALILNYQFDSLLGLSFGLRGRFAKRCCGAALMIARKRLSCFGVVAFASASELAGLLRMAQ